MAAGKKLNRNARIELRTTEQLKNYLVQKAAENNKTVNDYCTDVLKNFEYAEQLMQIESIQKQIIKLLLNIAIYIYQLARYCNTFKEAPQREILNGIFNELKRM